MVGVRKVQAKTRELQNKSEGDGRLAHTAENQQISHEKAEHYKSKHAQPPRPPRRTPGNISQGRVAQELACSIPTYKRMGCSAGREVISAMDAADMVLET